MKNFFVFLLGALIGAAVVYFVCCKSSSLESVAETPKGSITPAEAKALDEAFDSRHALISSDIVKRPDNRSSWYPLADFRQFLNSAEIQAKDLGYTMDGVRLYLGAYPDSDGEVGYTTMFFIPTGYLSKNNAEGSMSSFNFSSLKAGSSDIPGGNGLNGGDSGDPPSANYPQ